MSRMITQTDYNYRRVGEMSDEEFHEHEKWKKHRAEVRALEKIAKDAAKKWQPKVIRRSKETV